MEENKNNIPYIVFEGTMARMERTIARLWIVVIISIFLLVATNLAWFQYESQFEDATYTQEAEIDTGSGNAYVNNGGEMNYGESESKTNN